jgi:hypothetical protein
MKTADVLEKLSVMKARRRGAGLVVRSFVDDKLIRVSLVPVRGAVARYRSVLPSEVLR